MIKITICDISISGFYINKVTALMTFPVQTYLVDIQEEMLIVPIAPTTLELMIVQINRFAKITTNKLAVIGFMYEGFAVKQIECKINPNYQTKAYLRMNTCNVPGSTTTDQQNWSLSSPLSLFSASRMSSPQPGFLHRGNKVCLKCCEFF